MRLTQEEIESLQINYFRNAIQTPDGTILDSTHRHDYKEYVDTTCGDLYINDGGLDYLRRTINKTPYKDLSVPLDADIETIRASFTWSTYEKDRSKPLKRVLLKDLSNGHLENIVKDGYPIAPLMKLELKYRERMGIKVEDSKV